MRHVEDVLIGSAARLVIGGMQSASPSRNTANDGVRQDLIPFVVVAQHTNLLFALSDGSNS